MTPALTIAALQACGFRGRALAMQPADVAAAAVRLGCPLAMVEALLDVESSGHGFDAVGRPKILPERHIFYRQLAGKPAQAAAIAARLAYPNQGTLPYPAGSDACYAMLAQMCAIDATAALSSCSWGIAQVMGFNFALGGFGDVGAMVMACLESEANQFSLMLSYLEHANLGAALRRLDFESVASGYNGKGASAAYAARLRAAYAHHSATDPAPAKLSAPALTRPPLHPDQLSNPAWLAVRAGSAADHSADQLNAAELVQLHAGADASADALNAGVLARIHGVVR